MAPALDDASTDSDDSDVAFANLDFDGVDFGCGEEDGEGANDTPASADVPPDSGGGADARGEGGAEEYLPGGGGAAAASIGNGSDDGGPDRSAAAAAAGESGATTAAAARGLSSVAFSGRAIEPSETERRLLDAERDRLLPFPSDFDALLVDGETTSVDGLAETEEMFRMLEAGRYADILRSPFAEGVFGGGEGSATPRDGEEGASMIDRIKMRMLRSFEGQGSSVVR